MHLSRATKDFLAPLPFLVWAVGFGFLFLRLAFYNVKLMAKLEQAKSTARKKGDAEMVRNFKPDPLSDPFAFKSVDYIRASVEEREDVFDRDFAASFEDNYQMWLAAIRGLFGGVTVLIGVALVLAMLLN